MTAPDLLRYPIGPMPVDDAPEHRPQSTAAIRSFPGEFASAYRDLTGGLLDTPYRDGGWTLRQVAHHVADSHMNAFVRFKLALTEDWPTILPYNEKLWAQTAEIRGPVDAPLAILAALHARWADLLDSLTEEDGGAATCTRRAGVSR